MRVIVETSSDEVLASADEWLAFVASYDDEDLSERQFTYRFRERLFAAVYRCERDQYREWIDHGGQG